MFGTLLRFFLKPFRLQRRRCPYGVQWELIPYDFRKHTSKSAFAKWKEELSRGVLL